MFKRHAPITRWNAIAAALVAAVLAVTVAVPPATADHGKSRGRSKHKIVNRHHQRDHRDHPRTWRSDRQARPYPVWAHRPTRIHYYERRPFYFHTGFDVFFGGDGFWLQVGNIPPRGYVYYDPHCHRSFASVAIYRRHLHRHHHPAIIEVVVADDDYYYDQPVYWYDGCDYEWDDWD